MKRFFLLCSVFLSLTGFAFAGTLEYQIADMQRFDANKINRYRVRADIIIKDMITKPISDIIETSKLAASDLIKKNNVHAITIRAYPSRNFISGGMPLCITIYAPDGRGWSDTGYCVWSVEVAKPMPDLQTVRIAEEWGKLYPQYHRGISTDEKGLRKHIAKNLKIPYEDASPAFISLDKVE